MSGEQLGQVEPVSITAVCCNKHGTTCTEKIVVKAAARLSLTVVVPPGAAGVEPGSSSSATASQTVREHGGILFTGV